MRIIETFNSLEQHKDEVKILILVDDYVGSGDTVLGCINGIESHLEYCKIEKANYISHLKGKIEYGLFVNPYDYELKEYLSYLK